VDGGLIGSRLPPTVEEAHRVGYPYLPLYCQGFLSTSRSQERVSNVCQLRTKCVLVSAGLCRMIVFED
jgi:hypothetical protein